MMYIYGEMTRSSALYMETLPNRFAHLPRAAATMCIIHVLHFHLSLRALISTCNGNIQIIILDTVRASHYFVDKTSLYASRTSRYQFRSGPERNLDFKRAPFVLRGL